MLSIRLTLKTKSGKKKFYKLPKTSKVIAAYGKRLAKGISIELEAMGKVATGNLRDSVKFELGENTEAYIDFGISFGDAFYWDYVFQGVKGAISDAKAPDSPFQFGSGTGGTGMRGAIDRWTVIKGLQGTRDLSGRFVPRKSMVYAISRSIYLKGIAPTDYISKPFDTLTKQFEPKIQQAFADDMAVLVTDILMPPIDLKFA
jgi:hypothetical protein